VEQRQCRQASHRSNLHLEGRRHSRWHAEQHWWDNRCTSCVSNVATPRGCTCTWVALLLLLPHPTHARKGGDERDAGEGSDGSDSYSYVQLHMGCAWLHATQWGDQLCCRGMRERRVERLSLHSAVLDSITLSAPWTHRAVLHPHACTATGRVRLTPSRHLSLSTCPLRLYDLCRGSESALYMRAHLYVQVRTCTRVSWWGWRGYTRVRRHQRGLSVGGGCALLHTHPAPPRCTAPPSRAPRAPAPLSHHAPHSSVSNLQPAQRQHAPSRPAVLLHSLARPTHCGAARPTKLIRHSAQVLKEPQAPRYRVRLYARAL
jgi:hypothetical protein